MCAVSAGARRYGGRRFVQNATEFLNNRIESLPFQPTQAEVISFSLILVGVALWIFLKQKYQARAGTV